MASRHRNPNKPELVAIYRLEFYKNKKCWKFPSEKQLKSSKPACKPKKTGRNNTLNETYNVEQTSDLEQGKTSLNHAFMHEISTDKTSLEHSGLSPPPPTPQPQEGVSSDQATALHSEGCAKDIWSKPQLHQDKLDQDVWTNEVPGVNQQPLVNTQDQPTWDSNIQTLGTNTPTDHQSQCNNQEQPTINLQWLLKASTLDACYNPASPGHPNTWDNQVIPQDSHIQPEQNIWIKQPGYNQELMPQNTWKIPKNSLDKQGTSANLNDQASWLKKEDQYCRNSASDQWNEPVVQPQKWDNNQDPTQKKETSFILPDTSVPPPPLRTGNIWSDNPRMFRPNNPRLHRRTMGISTHEMLQAHQRPVYDHPRTQVPWVDVSLGSPRTEDPAQNVWEQAWQEKQALWLDGNKEWCDAEGAPDAPDGIYEEMATYLDTQIAQEKTLKPQPFVECYETPEEILRQTDCWLRRLMKVYHPGDHQYECEPSCEQYQRGCNDSSDFVREAHHVAHSSENDPNESLEWVWSLSSPGGLPALSPRRLAAAVLHVTGTLRTLLKEQLIRDQLKTDHATEVEEYPTRDKEVFAGEFVLSGSHLPRTTRGLGGEAPEHRLIKIDMGRPYRL